MYQGFLCRWAIAFLIFLYTPLISQLTGDLKIAFIRVSFSPGEFPGFTGNGKFLYDDNSICGSYTIDAPPHDANYFQSHIYAVDNYFRTVSYGKFGLDIDESKIFPRENRSSYEISQSMNYYHELGYESDHEKRTTELLKDALMIAHATDSINFSAFDIVAVIHAGVGQDFNLPFLDPTPEDIPSTFVDKDMINKYLGGPIQIGNNFVYSGIILPESQNYPLMDNNINEALSDPCDVQYSITGTWALMIGFAAGLPPLWHVESGKSGVGVFSLMDLGANNGRGIVPAPPDAWTRIYAGWESPVEIQLFNEVNLESNKSHQIGKININENEYFLIEYRNNWFRENVSIDSSRYSVWEETNDYPTYVKILIDSADISFNEFGVITEVENYNLGLPASGLLIWHIDENKINAGIDSYSVNANQNHRGVDLEEADGAQDIGYISNLLTDPSSGYWGDMWFPENKEYYRANSNGSMTFSSFTFPNTKSNKNANSGILINDISRSSKSMSFKIASHYDISIINDKNKSILFQWDVDNDGDLDFVGEDDSLWWSDNLEDFIFIENIDGKLLEVIVAQNSDTTSLAVLNKKNNKHIFKWIVFDTFTGNFSPKWKNEITNASQVKFLKADGDNESIWIIKDGKHLIIDSFGITETEIRESGYPYRSSKDISIVLWSDRIETKEDFTYYGDFKSLSLIDLENDGSSEIIALDNRGDIYAFDNNLLLKNGFPIQSNANAPILAMDLLGDNSPELIYQDKLGIIQILDHEGKKLDQISTTSKVKALGVYQGRHAIITSNALILYKDDLNGFENEWNYKYSTPDNSRFLSNYKSQGKPGFIFDLSQTYAYPNPSFNENIIFRINVGLAESLNINIFDIAGFLVENFSIDISSSQNSIKEVHWDISSINPGIYLARIVGTDGLRKEQKIIKVGIVK